MAQYVPLYIIHVSIISGISSLLLSVVKKSLQNLRSWWIPHNITLLFEEPISSCTRNRYFVPCVQLRVPGVSKEVSLYLHNAQITRSPKVYRSDVIFFCNSLMTCHHAFDKTTWQPKNTSLSRSLRIVRVNASLVTTFLRENSFSFQSFVKSLTCSTIPQWPDRISVNLKFYHKTLAMNFFRKRFSVWSLWNSQSASNPFGSTALSKGQRERETDDKKKRIDFRCPYEFGYQVQVADKTLTVGHYSSSILSPFVWPLLSAVSRATLAALHAFSASGNSEGNGQLGPFEEAVWE